MLPPGSSETTWVHRLFCCAAVGGSANRAIAFFRRHLRMYSRHARKQMLLSEAPIISVCGEQFAVSRPLTNRSGTSPVFLIGSQENEEMINYFLANYLFSSSHMVHFVQK